MAANLFLSIAKDLNLSSWFDEHEDFYESRILYSAMSLWLKTIVLDSESDETINQVSQRHLFIRGTQILNEFLLVNPTLRPWFFSKFEEDPNKEEYHPIRLIRSRLLKTGEIFENGFQTGLSLPAYAELDIGMGIKRLIGIPPKGITCASVTSGITRIFIGSDLHTDEDAKSNTAIQWFIRFTESLKWETSISDERKEYFNPNKKETTLYKCWEFRKQTQSNITLTRREIGHNIYEYYIEKQQSKHNLIHRIDDYLIERKEQRRMMYALRMMAGNAVEASAHQMDDFVLLDLYTKLPDKERALLYTYAWPKRHIDDELQWVIPLAVWPLIVKTICNLNIQIEECQHG